MTWKRVTYSDHALGRMAERGVRRPEIRYLLAKGALKKEHSFGEPRWSRSGYLDGEEAKVVFIERHDEIHVVTIMWAE